VDALFSITVPFNTGGAQEEITQGKVLAGCWCASQPGRRKRFLSKVVRSTNTYQV